MAIFYSLGDALVADDELIEKDVKGYLAKFNKNRKTAEVLFSTGVLTGKNIIESYISSNGEIIPFKPIELGKPLTIEIRHVYTGKHPKKKFLDPSKDMLITTAMKSIAAFNAAPRAVNFLKKNVRAKHNVMNPSATDEGTPLIHYTPALIQKNTVLTLEIGFDEFPDEIFSIAKNALTQAAGLPIFASSSSYLLAAGAITKIIGDLGSRLFDSSPVFKATEPLYFYRAGSSVPQAGYRLITEDDVNPSLLKNFKINENGQLVNDNGEPYDGDTPYIVISLDGNEMEEYANFAPTAASAALLERFYKINDGQEQPLGPLMDALKLYNDWKFRKEADALEEEIKDLEPDSEEYKEKKEQYDALVANILDDLLKPKVQD